MLTRTELGLSPGDFAVFSAGDLNENKNHRALVEAMVDLPKNVRFFIAGDGPLREEIEELAERLGVAERVTLLGFRSDIPALMNAADLFCMPSKREGLPVSLIEAMSTGTPVLASDARGCSDVLGWLADRLIFRERDGGSWAGRIASIVQNGASVTPAELRSRAAAFGIGPAVSSLGRIYEDAFVGREAA